MRRILFSFSFSGISDQFAAKFFSYRIYWCWNSWIIWRNPLLTVYFLSTLVRRSREAGGENKLGVNWLLNLKALTNTELHIGQTLYGSSVWSARDGVPSMAMLDHRSPLKTWMCPISFCRDCWQKADSLLKSQTSLPMRFAAPLSTGRLRCRTESGSLDKLVVRMSNHCCCQRTMIQSASTRTGTGRKYRFICQSLSGS